MNFICKKMELFEAISNVSKAIPIKSSIPQLEGIKISLEGNKLTLTGYDLELGITTSIEVTNDDNSLEEYIVNHRLFADMVKKMPSEEINITINKDNDMKAHIKAEHINCKIAVLSAKDYPELPDTSNGDVIEIPQNTLKEMIEQTSYAVAISDIKPILTGELFDIKDGKFNLVAIDGKRLAIKHENISYNNEIQFVVPAKTLNEISKLLKNDKSNKDDDDKLDDCKIVSTSKHIMFQIDKYTIISRLLEGHFHDYKSSIPKNYKTEVMIKTRVLTECLERCSLLINEKNRAPVKLHFKDNILKIVCETPLGNIDEEIKINMSGDNLLIGLNNKFLLEAIRATDSDQIKIQMNSPISPVTIMPIQGESFTFLLMPIQLKENQNS